MSYDEFLAHFAMQALLNSLRFGSNEPVPRNQMKNILYDNNGYKGNVHCRIHTTTPYLDEFYTFTILGRGFYRWMMLKNWEGADPILLNKEWVLIIPIKTTHTRVYLVKGLNNYMLSPHRSPIVSLYVLDPRANERSKVLSTAEQSCVSNLKNGVWEAMKIPARLRKVDWDTSVVPMKEVASGDTDEEYVDDLLQQFKYNWSKLQSWP